VAVEWRQDAITNLRRFPRNIRDRVWKAVGSRLGTGPTLYGTRLKRSLAGLWKLRVGDIRVIYAVASNRVTIWAVGDRQDVYPEVERRSARAD